MNNMENRIDELIKILNKASYEYYTLDKPTITDQEYDRYMQELLSIEEIPITDSRLQTAWKHSVYRTLITPTNYEIEMRIS